MDGSAVGAQYPVVLRFEGLYPQHLAGYEAHRTRKGGDLGHIDKARSGQNRRLIGDADWAAQARAEIDEITQENFAAELESLDKRNRKKDLHRRMVEGPKDPWRPTRHGPMREVILTVNREWFDSDLGTFFGGDRNEREADFEDRAVAWLQENFGEDVIHARADLDESAYHIHAVILPRVTVEIKGAQRKMLQPSKHPLIKDYEAAQDSVGEWFADLGLTRGERRAEAIRDARARGETPPPKRRHTRPKTWRENEERRIAAESANLDDRTRKVEAREDEAEAMVAVAEGIASGDMTLDDSAEAPKVVETGQRRDTAPSTPRLADLRQRSPKGVARATAMLTTVWERLRGRAQQEARAGIADAVAELSEADDKLVEIAGHLPRDQRGAIARMRRGLTAQLDSLRSRFEPRDRSGRDPDSR